MKVCSFLLTNQIFRVSENLRHLNDPFQFQTRAIDGLEESVQIHEPQNQLHTTTSTNMTNPNSSQNVLRARKGVIKMLIIVVCAFAICNLPFHARKMWQCWSADYHGDTNFSAILTPVTFLSMYFNSGVNPLLYAFLSKNFRR